MEKEKIEAEINTYADGHNNSDWYIGITDDVDERKSSHESDYPNMSKWGFWQADSEQDARDVEAKFLDKGFDGGKGGGKRPIFVYVFLKG